MNPREPNLIASIILLILGGMCIFHVLVMVGALPAEMVWGGRAANSRLDLLLMEASALIVTLLFMLVIAMKAGYILSGRLTRTVTVAVWVIAVYFALNIIGNLTSASMTEQLVFIPVAAALSVLSFMLAVKK
ncbi:hypothetical protein KKC97_09650 [bacterium]|nr:hypothetical protein [bacterium]